MAGRFVLTGRWGPARADPRNSNDVPALSLAGCFNDNVVPVLLPERQLRDDVAVRIGVFTATPGRRCCQRAERQSLELHREAALSVGADHDRVAVVADLPRHHPVPGRALFRRAHTERLLRGATSYRT